MVILPRTSNDALNVNPPAGDEYLSVHGSDWLWAVTAIYIVSFLALFALTFAARAGEKIFHYIFAIALLVGAITYFANASDLAWSLVGQADEPENGFTRQIFFAKYINWVVSFPAVILSLGLLSGVSWATILYNIFLSWIWVISYLVGAYTVTNYKWGFFVFGTVAWAALAGQTLGGGHVSARRVGVAQHHTTLSGWVNLLWLLYPIAWGLTDGGNRIGLTAGFVFFGVLDVLMVPLLAFAFIFLARNWDYGRLNIAFTQYGRVRQGGDFPEKGAAAAPAAPATGGLAA